MTTSTEVLLGLNLLRGVLELPNSLSKAALHDFGLQVRELGDAAYFNAGWHAANPSAELKGAAASETLTTKIQKLTAEIFEKTRPKRGRGRPSSEDIHPDYLSAVAVVSLGHKSQKRDLIRLCLKEGWLKDRVELKDGVRQTTTFDAHVKQIDRELAKLAKRRASRPPNNILNIHPRKPAGR